MLGRRAPLLLSRLGRCRQAAACRSLASRPADLSQPLNLFVCAADAASDQAGAALLAALKQLHGRPVNVYGVGGSLLQAQGLRSVVTEEQFSQLAAAEVLQPPGGVQQLVASLKSKAAYLKIFSDAICKAALDGCRSSPVAQQQLQQATGVPAKVPRGLSFDAVLAIGSPVASQQLLFFLRKAQEARKAQLPVVVKYLASGLWDSQQLQGASETWAKLADHVMCGLPFEPALLEAAGCPASFVGQPLVEQQLLQQSSFGSREPRLLQLLAQRREAAAAEDSRGSSSSSSWSAAAAAGPPVFAASDPAAFWRFFDRVHEDRRQAALAEAAGSTGGSDSSSSTSVSTLTKRPRKPASSSSSSSAKAGPQSFRDRPLLLLLAGSTEAEVASCMPGFDAITRALLQQHPGLVAAMVVPDLLVDEACLATNNFALPLVVLPASSALCSNAAAAAAAALSHAGPVSLAAAVAGLPLVCVRPGRQSLLDGVKRWQLRHQLPYNCVPNLVAGCAAVPEFRLFERGGEEGAARAVAELLACTGAGPPASPVARTSQPARVRAAEAAGSTGPALQPSHAAWEQQRAGLQHLLLELLPDVQQQPGRSSSIKASEAAARVLLELIELRRQQEAEQGAQHLEAAGSAATQRAAGEASSRSLAAVAAE